MKKSILIGILVAVLAAAGLVARAVLRSAEAGRLTDAAQAAGALDDMMGYVEAESLAREAVKLGATPEREALLAWLQGMWALRGGPPELWERAEVRLARLERDPVQPALASAARALVALEKKKAGDAILEAGRGLSAHPRRPELLWVRARAERAMEKPAEAQKTLDESLALAPDFMPALYERGLVLRSRGKKKEAVAALGEVARRSGRHQATVLLGELMLDGARDKRAAFGSLLAIATCDQLEQSIAAHFHATGKQPSAGFSAAYQDGCAASAAQNP